MKYEVIKEVQNQHPTYEDWILLLAPLFGAGASSNLSGILPGITSGLVIGLLIAALGKALAGVGQNVKSYEDWWLFALTFIGLILTGFTGNGQYALAGSLIGFLGKAIGTFASRLLTLEDVLLLIGSLIAIYGMLATNATATNIGILLLAMGKATPSLPGNGKTAHMRLQT